VRPWLKLWYGHESFVSQWKFWCCYAAEYRTAGPRGLGCLEIARAGGPRTPWGMTSPVFLHRLSCYLVRCEYVFVERLFDCSRWSADARSSFSHYPEQNSTEKYTLHLLVPVPTPVPRAKMITECTEASLSVYFKAWYILNRHSGLRVCSSKYNPPRYNLAHPTILHAHVPGKDRSCSLVEG
jgi:hypothetical protein